ncbi:hypothetical protein MJ561_15515 [Klebsiella pneumoniae]|nr:hypothetical protein MJ561_15515 [Klebsiella pneumoniae]
MTLSQSDQRATPRRGLAGGRRLQCSELARRSGGAGGGASPAASPAAKQAASAGTSDWPLQPELHSPNGMWVRWRRLGGLQRSRNSPASVRHCLPGGNAGGWRRGAPRLPSARQLMLLDQAGLASITPAALNIFPEQRGLQHLPQARDTIGRASAATSRTRYGERWWHSRFRRRCLSRSSAPVALSAVKQQMFQQVTST